MTRSEPTIQGRKLVPLKRSKRQYGLTEKSSTPTIGGVVEKTVSLNTEEIAASARETLEDLPEIGSVCGFDSPGIADLRMLPVPKFKNYLIFYRHIREEVEILRVLHGARDVPSLFVE